MYFEVISHTPKQFYIPKNQKLLKQSPTFIVQLNGIYRREKVSPSKTQVHESMPMHSNIK